MPRITLLHLILLFALASASATLINALLVAYTLHKRTLIDTALETNRVYAAKLAESISDSLAASFSKLSYSAKLLGHAFEDTNLLNDESGRLLLQDSTFNSVLVADHTGTVISATPSTLGIVGQQLRSRDALQAKRPIISPAFQSLAGNLVVFISHPIFNKEGEFLGLIGGTIHLNKTNSLHSIIDNHFHSDASIIYLIDQSRRLLYHSDSKRVGEHVGANPIIDAVLRGENGTMQAHNSRGIEMLAGYASIDASDWGVVVQIQLADTLHTLQELMNKLILGMIPMCLLGLSLIAWIASRISRPLKQLADCASHLDSSENVERIERIERINANYYEAHQLRSAMLKGVRLLQERIGQLNIQVQSDPLTGLANRRALEDRLDLWQESGMAFAVLAVDIDHFKRVNDNFGHDTGDVILKTVAQNLRQCLRSVDLPCRVGGEEFIVLLPETSLTVAGEVAERIRCSIEAMSTAPVGQVTVSLGVAQWHIHIEPVAMALKRADELLYAAKQAGRNRTISEQTSKAREVPEHA